METYFTNVTVITIEAVRDTEFPNTAGVMAIGIEKYWHSKTTIDQRLDVCIGITIEVSAKVDWCTVIIEAAVDWPFLEYATTNIKEVNNSTVWSFNFHVDIWQPGMVIDLDTNIQVKYWCARQVAIVKGILECVELQQVVQASDDLRLVADEFWRWLIRQLSTAHDCPVATFDRRWNLVFYADGTPAAVAGRRIGNGYLEGFTNSIVVNGHATEA